MKKLKPILSAILSFSINAVLTFLITSILLVFIFGFNMRYFHLEISGFNLGFITGSISTFVMTNLTIIGKAKRDSKKLKIVN